MDDAGYLGLANYWQRSMRWGHNTVLAGTARSVRAADEWMDETMAHAERPIKGEKQVSKPAVMPTPKSGDARIKVAFQSRWAFAGLGDL